MHEFSGITVNNGEKDRFWIGFRELILADRPFILLILLSLYEVETRLTKQKAEKGKDLYVKIIIPENSGLTYNEAWNFMRNLLVKYDYYYQE